MGYSRHWTKVYGRRGNTDQRSEDKRIREREYGSEKGNTDWKREEIQIGQHMEYRSEKRWNMDRVLT